MITPAKYRELKSKIVRHDAWIDSIRNPRNGWASYREEDIPKHVPRVTNPERSQVETYEFLTQKPERYFVYVQRHMVEPGAVDRNVTVTTFTGQVLGHGRLGRMYRCGASLRYPIRFTALNGVHYAGTYYSSSGDYARVKKVKS